MFNINKFNKLKENLQLEVKSALNGLPNSIWETYSSFANTHCSPTTESESKKYSIYSIKYVK